EAGHQLVVDEATKSIEACIEKNELAPEGCPFMANPNLENGDITPDMSTLEFTVDDSQFRDLQLRVDYDNPLVVKFLFLPKIKWKLRGVRSIGSDGWYDAAARSTVLRYGQMDFSGDAPTFSWVTR